MGEETIYNLITKENVPPENPEKETRYISKYPHRLPLTGSTFAVFTTFIPRVIFFFSCNCLENFSEYFEPWWRLYATIRASFL